MSQDSSILAASKRIQQYIHRTPIVTSETLNDTLGHQVYFKAECLQKVGAFKARGACNTIAKLVEEGKTPARVVANSSGNHAQAVAWAASKFGIPATIYTQKSTSSVKKQATAAYGAEVILKETRNEVDEAVEQAAEEEGVVWVPPFNHEDVIAGQGTVAYEIYQEIKDVDGIFAPCGGGGLLAGTIIATKEFSPRTKVFGAEPINADDAKRSLLKGSIFKFDNSPDTIADGARTLAVGKLSFHYLKHLTELFTVEEKAILYWTQWLSHLLKLRVEPTSAMSMDAVCRWLKTQSTPQKVVVILTGGNIDAATTRKIWEKDYLVKFPTR